LLPASGCRAAVGATQKVPHAVAHDELAQATKAKDREAAAAALEAERLAALWTYHELALAKGKQLSAAINSTNDVETDGSAPRRVQLVFRDHPSWGRSSYLVLQGGDFNCYGSCTVKITTDGESPRSMAARRPRTDEAIAMFINDGRTLWSLTATGKQLSIEFPLKGGGTRTAIFDVAGLDRSKMPGWDAAVAAGRQGGTPQVR
jgi:hypothetical protein